MAKRKNMQISNIFIQLCLTLMTVNSEDRERTFIELKQVRKVDSLNENLKDKGVVYKEKEIIKTYHHIIKKILPPYPGDLATQENEHSDQIKEQENPKIFEENISEGSNSEDLVTQEHDDPDQIKEPEKPKRVKENIFERRNSGYLLTKKNEQPDQVKDDKEPKRFEEDIFEKRNYLKNSTKYPSHVNFEKMNLRHEPFYKDIETLNKLYKEKTTYRQRSSKKARKNMSRHAKRYQRKFPPYLQRRGQRSVNNTGKYVEDNSPLKSSETITITDAFTESSISQNDKDPKDLDRQVRNKVTITIDRGKQHLLEADISKPDIAKNNSNDSNKISKSPKSHHGHHIDVFLKPSYGNPSRIKPTQKPVSVYTMNKPTTNTPNIPTAIKTTAAITDYVPIETSSKIPTVTATKMTQSSISSKSKNYNLWQKFWQPPGTGFDFYQKPHRYWTHLMATFTQPSTYTTPSNYAVTILTQPGIYSTQNYIQPTISQTEFMPVPTQPGIYSTQNYVQPTIPQTEFMTIPTQPGIYSTENYVQPTISQTKFTQPSSSSTETSLEEIIKLIEDQLPEGKIELVTNEVKIKQEVIAFEPSNTTSTNSTCGELKIHDEQKLRISSLLLWLMGMFCLLTIVGMAFLIYISNVKDRIYLQSKNAQGTGRTFQHTFYKRGDMPVLGGTEETPTNNHLAEDIQLLSKLIQHALNGCRFYQESELLQMYSAVEHIKRMVKSDRGRQLIYS